ncbi:MAG: hypothetical protein ACI9CO_000291 [Candidatus Azotimanducaceae bacterium]|jgi:hypothetical protein
MINANSLVYYSTNNLNITFQFQANFMKNLNLLLTSTVLAISCWFNTVNASVITVDNWWLQTDTNGGLRESTTNSDYFFAVSQSNTWDRTATYESIAGYRIASTAEGQSVFNQGNTSGIFTYFNQGGWTGFDWEGVKRLMFRFSDSDITLAYKHAGNYDEAALSYGIIANRFAGFVMVKDAYVAKPKPKRNNVSEPSIIALLALGLVGIGFARRRQS